MALDGPLALLDLCALISRSRALDCDLPILFLKRCMMNPGRIKERINQIVVCRDLVSRVSVQGRQAEGPVGSRER